MTDFLTTPLAVDQYSRFNASMFDEKEHIMNPTGFLSIFGRPEANGSQTRYSPDSLDVDIEIIRGNERIAALVPRGTIASTMSGSVAKKPKVQKRSEFSRTFPLSEEESSINANLILNRMAGESATENRGKLVRLRQHAATLHKEHVRRTIRLWEYLAAQSLLEGVQPAILGTTNTDLIYDWRRNPAHIANLTYPWSNALSDPLADIDAAWMLGRVNGHVNQDYTIWADGVMNAFLGHADITAKADNRRFELIMINQEMPVPNRYKFLIDGGMTARGRLLTPGGHEYWIFTYADGIKTDDAGDPVAYLPEGYAFFGYSGARCDRWFGPAEMLPNIPMRQQFYQQMLGFNLTAPPMPPNVNNAGNVLNPGMFYFDAYPTEGWKSMMVRTQSAPMFPTTQTDAFVTYKLVTV